MHWCIMFICCLYFGDCLELPEKTFRVSFSFMELRTAYVIIGGLAALVCVMGWGIEELGLVSENLSPTITPSCA